MSGHVFPLHPLEANQLGGNWLHGRFRLERLITLTTVGNKRRWLSHRDITAASASQAKSAPHSTVHTLSPHHLSTAHIRSPVSRYRCEAKYRQPVKLTVKRARHGDFYTSLIKHSTIRRSYRYLHRNECVIDTMPTDHTHTVTHTHTCLLELDAL